MEEPVVKKKVSKLEAICAALSGLIAGLLGISIPVWYVHTRLNNLDDLNSSFIPNTILYIIALFVFQMSFLATWAFIWNFFKKIIVHLRDKKGGE